MSCTHNSLLCLSRAIKRQMLSQLDKLPFLNLYQSTSSKLKTNSLGKLHKNGNFFV